VTANWERRDTLPRLLAAADQIFGGVVRTDEVRAFLPPASLPAVLSSVDDVARVAEAAGLARRGRGWWELAHGDRVVSVMAQGDPVAIVHWYSPDGSAFPDGARVATVCSGAPGALLWAAIQAARGGEPG
jgi:hypothetical protein